MGHFLLDSLTKCGTSISWVCHYIHSVLNVLSNLVVTAVENSQVTWFLLSCKVIACDSVSLVYKVQRWRVIAKKYRLHSLEVIFNHWSIYACISVSVFVCDQIQLTFFSVFSMCALLSGRIQIQVTVNTHFFFGLSFSL